MKPNLKFSRPIRRGNGFLKNRGEVLKILIGLRSNLPKVSILTFMMPRSEGLLQSFLKTGIQALSIRMLPPEFSISRIIILTPETREKMSEI